MFEKDGKEKLYQMSEKSAGSYNARLGLFKSTAPQVTVLSFIKIHSQKLQTVY